MQLQNFCGKGGGVIQLQPPLPPVVTPLITETDLSEKNVINLNTLMDLADIMTGRKKCSELTRDEKYRYYKNHFTRTKNNHL